MSTLLEQLNQPITPASDLHDKQFVFERGYNPFTTFSGWKTVGEFGPDPVGGAMCLHDVLEHFPEMDAQVHSEYLALGAAFHIRHNGGFFKQQATTLSDENALVKPAFGMLFHHILNHGLPTYECPVDSAHHPLRNFGVETEMMRALGNARRFLRVRFGVNKGYAIDASLRYALPWLRLGYKRARKRFHGFDITLVSKMFKKTADLIDSATSVSPNPKFMSYRLNMEKLVGAVRVASTLAQVTESAAPKPQAKAEASDVGSLAYLLLRDPYAYDLPEPIVSVNGVKVEGPVNAASIATAAARAALQSKKAAVSAYPFLDPYSYGDDLIDI